VNAPRILVAGIGNIFLGDDGFGPAAVRGLTDLLPDIRVVDYGIRGLHLAYDLLAGCDALIIVDALPGTGPPGEITVLEVGPGDLPDGEPDPHGMHPATVLTHLARMGGTLPATYVVGCRPATVAEGIGLSPAVAAAVPTAQTAVHTLVARLAARPATTPAVAAEGRRAARPATTPAVAAEGRRATYPATTPGVAAESRRW
jgi:hydrogenase maturation protease